MSTPPLYHADRIGFAASFLCALHCALIPVLLGVLPALGLNFGGWVEIDEAFVVFASVLGVTTLTLGWRRHRMFLAWIVLLFGLGLLWVGAFTPVHEQIVLHAVLMTLGGVFVAGAHFLNMRLTHAHTHACGCSAGKTAVDAKSAVVRADAC